MAIAGMNKVIKLNFRVSNPTTRAATSTGSTQPERQCCRYFPIFLDSVDEVTKGDTLGS
jgi:hypothetical protein